MEEQDQYLDFLINPSFQDVNSYFVLSFKDTDDRRSYHRYDLPLVEIEDYNVVIDGRNFFNRSVKS